MGKNEKFATSLPQASACGSHLEASASSFEADASTKRYISTSSVQRNNRKRVLTPAEDVVIFNSQFSTPLRSFDRFCQKHQRHTTNKENAQIQKHIFIGQNHGLTADNII